MREMVESATYLFADGTKIFREIREENDEKMLQADLDSLQSWSDTWLLKFHPNKCKDCFRVFNMRSNQSLE